MLPALETETDTLPVLIICTRILQGEREQIKSKQKNVKNLNTAM